MVRRTLQNLTLGIMILGFATGCNFRVSQDETPTHDPATIAAWTLEAVFTHVASQSEQTSQGEKIPVGSPSEAKASRPTTDEVCVNRAHFVDDITIRDNMQIERGACFIKIWRLRNDGTCVWNRSYRLTFFGGERMGAPNTFLLPEIVQPGQTIDLAIDLTAPEEPGTYQGFWRLQSGDGDYFGIGSKGDQSFWVKISVIPSQDATPTVEGTPTLNPSGTPSPSGTPTPTETPSPSATPTLTPSVHTRGEVKLVLDQDVDLDTGKISPAEGGDVILDEDTPSQYALKPQNNSLLAIYSGMNQPPSKHDCEHLPKSPDVIPFSELAVNDNLCYITDEGRPGYLTISALDSSIDFSFTSWVP